MQACPPHSYSYTNHAFKDSICLLKHTNPQYFLNFCEEEKATPSFKLFSVILKILSYNQSNIRDIVSDKIYSISSWTHRIEEVFSNAEKSFLKMCLHKV